MNLYHFLICWEKTVTLNLLEFLHLKLKKPFEKLLKLFNEDKHTVV